MVRIFADGDRRHRLEDLAGRHIGWVRHRVIGFHGFLSEGRAMSAAADAWRALERALRREYAGRPPSDVDTDELRLVTDGVAEWIADDRLTLARLRRPSVTDTQHGNFSIEFELPSYATDGVVIAAAHAMAGAVQQHRWRLEEPAMSFGGVPAYPEAEVSTLAQRT
jgi:hypothetical protein